MNDLRNSILFVFPRSGTGEEKQKNRLIGWSYLNSSSRPIFGVVKRMSRFHTVTLAYPLNYIRAHRRQKNYNCSFLRVRNNSINLSNKMFKYTVSQTNSPSMNMLRRVDFFFTNGRPSLFSWRWPPLFAPMLSRKKAALRWLKARRLTIRRAQSSSSLPTATIRRGTPQPCTRLPPSRP